MISKLSLLLILSAFVSCKTTSTRSTPVDVENTTDPERVSKKDLESTDWDDVQDFNNKKAYFDVRREYDSKSQNIQKVFFATAKTTCYKEPNDPNDPMLVVSMSDLKTGPVSGGTEEEALQELEYELIPFLQKVFTDENIVACISFIYLRDVEKL